MVAVSSAPRLLLLFSYPPVDDVDPVQNTDVLGGIEKEDLSFPFVADQKDIERIGAPSLADK